VEVEALTTFFAILDGETSLEGQAEDFILLEEGKDEPLTGSLTAIFINIDNPDGRRYS
jgi:hypothetical protein